MMRVAYLAGDGIGPEITHATKSVLAHLDDRFGLGLLGEEFDIGFSALERDGCTLPSAVREAVQHCDGIVLGPVSHNDYPAPEAGGLNPSGVLRKTLELYANIRPARTRSAITPQAGIAFDLVIVRENTEGFYADRNLHQGHGDLMITPDVAVALRRITRQASLDIARAGFELAAQRSGHVTAVHKANVMRQSCGLFLECCRTVSKEYPDVIYDEQLVDAMAAHLVRAPDGFDVIVTTNMFGDILSDLASELSGSLGLAASLNAGRDHAMAQAQHGSAPDIAGQDIANPISLISSAGMLLQWLGQRHERPAFLHAANALDGAIEEMLHTPQTRTRDLGGPLGTAAFTDELIKRLCRE